MSKKSSGLFTLLTGVAMGAAAVFFSKKENRQEAQKVAKQVKTKAVTAAAEYKKDPTAFKKKVVSKGKAVAKKAVVAVRKKVATTAAVKKTASKTKKK
jgi:alkyl hydroperoxide reductase subunit AhpF